MSVTAQSDEYGTVTAYLTVDDPDAWIEFVTSVFDATLLRINREDNWVQHARVKIGDTVIMMNQSSEEYAATVVRLHVLVHDVDAVFDAACQTGGMPVMHPNLRPHGDRMAGVLDPGGNTWWIASKVTA